MILFDRATATDLLDALRLLEGRRRPGGQRLSAGAQELRMVAERSLRSPTVALPTPADVVPDDAVVDPHLLTLEDVCHRLSFGRTKVKAEISSGRLRAVHIGRLVRVHSADLADYLDGLRDEAA